MILYFKEKSKNMYLKWGIFIVFDLIALYMILRGVFWQNTLSTLQVIHPNLEYSEKNTEQSPTDTPEVSKREYLYVASSRGTYYYPKDCAKAKVLSVKNMLYFKDKMSAQEAGYVPHTSCF